MLLAAPVSAQVDSAPQKVVIARSNSDIREHAKYSCERINEGLVKADDFHASSGRYVLASKANKDYCLRVIVGMGDKSLNYKTNHLSMCGYENFTKAVTPSEENFMSCLRDMSQIDDIANGDIKPSYSPKGNYSATPVDNSVSEKLHSKCLEARDYQGCIAVFSGTEVQRPIQNQALPAGCQLLGDDGNCALFNDGETPAQRKFFGENYGENRECPPGKQMYRTRGLFGLGARDLGCMTAYEAESLNLETVKSIQQNIQQNTQNNQFKTRRCSTSFIGSTAYTNCSEY